MCDTSVALGNATADGSVIFAKNSDRKANECQPLGYYPRREHPPGSRVACTHREIPQARETFAVLGSRPYWMWGFEIGVNEHGVAMGNEAVHGRAGHVANGLLGMDLLRLGLERACTADEALRVVVGLLEEFGQGGNADLIEPRSYHNSYIIADPRTAWVLETAGQHWAAERVRDRRAISNCFTITTAWDEASSDLIDHAVRQGWWNPRDEFNFALAYGDPVRDTRSGQCRYRRAKTALGDGHGLGVSDLLAVLRDHQGTIEDENGSVPTPICMHEAPPRIGATAASFVAQLRPNSSPPLGAVVWHSFGSPCLSAVTPLYVQAGPTPAILGVGRDRFDSSSPWWLVERLQRRCDAFPKLAEVTRSVLREVEREAFATAGEAEKRARGLPPAEASRLLDETTHALVKRFLAVVRELDARTAELSEALPPLDPAARTHWETLNHSVGISLTRGPAEAALT